MVKNFHAIPGPEWGRLIFSPDSRHLIYVTRAGRKFAVVIDGRIGRSWDVITAGPIFNPSGEHFAYTAVENGQPILAVDDQPVSTGKVISPMFWFLGQGPQMAYAVQRPAGAAIDVDENEGKTYPVIDVSTVKTSDRGAHITYVAKDNRGYVVVKDQQEFGGYSHLFTASLTLSSDGQRVAYVIFRDGHWRVVADGHEQRGPDFLRSGQEVGPLFSPEGRHLAYAAWMKDKCCVVLDGIPGDLYDNVEHLVFGADNQRLAYVAEGEGSHFVVINEERGPKYDLATGPRFSPDGQHIAYMVWQQGRCFVALDRDLRGPYAAVRYSNLVFSPDSQHLALVVADSRGEFVVNDWKAGRRYQEVNPYTLRFSPDSEHLVYVGKRRGEEFVVLDEVEGPAYTYIFDKGLPKFVENGTVKYLAQRGDHTYWVTQAISE